MEIIDSIKRFPIKNLRRVSPTIVAGPTLENLPDILPEIRKAGVSAIVDFRDVTTNPFWQYECRQFNINYFKIGLDNTINSLPQNISNDFILKLKKFLSIMNNGHAYIGCQYGIDRTNAALILNYFLNPQKDKFDAPIILSGTFETKSKKPDIVHKAINRTVTRIWKMIKKMSPEQRAEFNLKGDIADIYRNAILPQINKIIKVNSKNLSKIV